MLIGFPIKPAEEGIDLLVVLFCFVLCFCFIYDARAKPIDGWPTRGDTPAIGRKCNFTPFGHIPYALRSFKMSVTDNAGGMEPAKRLTLRHDMVFAQTAFAIYELMPLVLPDTLLRVLRPDPQIAVVWMEV